MKLHYLNRACSQDRSFSVTKNRHPYFLKIWHHHPELELVYVQKSTGTRFIGDNIEKFEAGEVILIGANLPHMWLNDDAYFEKDSTLFAEAVATHFRKDFFGPSFFEFPEMAHISKMLDKAAYGIKFLNLDEKTKVKIEALQTGNGFEKALKLITVLNDLSLHNSYELLSSNGFVNSFKKTEHAGLEKIYNYIFNNFNEPISLQDVSDIAGMNPSAFSRFFKRVQRKSFSKFINEVRVGYACKMLLEEKFNITQICYDSGFNNISNFNRQFKAITSFSPTQYVRNHRID
ncbi:MAG: AraC family transcriptional regulator [Bacteroidota bacterium]